MTDTKEKMKTKIIKKKRKNANNYIDNERLMAELIKYKKAVRKAKREKTEKPQLTNYIAECILLVAKNLALASNFRNYSYIDEMMDDGIENCLKYIDNFDPKKTNSPFAYLTTIMYYAFVRRILVEKKQQKIKEAALENFIVFGESEGVPVSSMVDNDVLLNFMKMKEKNDN